MRLVPPVPDKQDVLQDLVLVAVVLLRALEEADCVGDTRGVEVVGGGVAEGGAQDVPDFVAGGGGVVDCFEGEAEERAVGLDDLGLCWAGTHLLTTRVESRRADDRGR